MIEVIATFVLGPLSALYIAGPIAGALQLPLLGVQLGVTLGVGITPGYFTTADKVTAALTSTLLILWLLVLLYMMLWYKVEAYFCTMPWLRHQSQMQAVQGGRKYATRCPFSGHRPTMRCPNCEARVHDSAFHKSDRLVRWVTGDTVLRWEPAKACTDSNANIKKVRQRLDQYLDYRGNVLFGSVSDCCVGCSVWQKSFNLLPRLSISLASASLLFVFVPWAFAEFLDGSDDSAQSIGEGSGKAIHITCNVLAVVYAQAALVVQTHALLRANEFLEKHSPMIPSLKPLFCMPKSALLRLVWRAPWDPEV